MSLVDVEDPDELLARYSKTWLACHQDAMDQIHYGAVRHRVLGETQSAALQDALGLGDSQTQAKGVLPLLSDCDPNDKQVLYRVLTAVCIQNQINVRRQFAMFVIALYKYLKHERFTFQLAVVFYDRLALEQYFNDGEAFHLKQDIHEVIELLQEFSPQLLEAYASCLLQPMLTNCVACFLTTLLACRLTDCSPQNMLWHAEILDCLIKSEHRISDPRWKLRWIVSSIFLRHEKSLIKSFEESGKRGLERSTLRLCQGAHVDESLLTLINNEVDVLACYNFHARLFMPIGAVIGCICGMELAYMPFGHILGAPLTSTAAGNALACVGASIGALVAGTLGWDNGVAATRDSMQGVLDAIERNESPIFSSETQPGTFESEMSASGANGEDGDSDHRSHLETDGPTSLAWFYGHD